MMRSLYSGVTGLRSHQTKMDVIGNNIANVNTVGYKSSRVMFQDVFSETIRPASGAGTITGGTNPQQIGLGTSLAAIDVLFTPGATQNTGGTMDFSISGDGYFVLSNGSDSYSYTRAGNFYTDLDNKLVSANGQYIQGYRVKLADGTPDYKDSDNDGTPDVPNTLVMENIMIPDNYYDVSIDKNGMVIGLDKTTNARSYLGQVVLATFNNQSGLEKAGNNTYTSTLNSGDPNFSTPGASGAGELKPGSLEMSNVDLANEFTDMITTQRGFQANSRVITTTDQLLEELVNLRR